MPPNLPAVRPPGDPRLHDALAQVDLLHGEQIVYSLLADGFFLGANPAAKALAAMRAALVAMTGGYVRIYLVVTSHRVLVLKNTQVWCGCTKLREVASIALAGIKEIGSSKQTHLCCVHTRTLRLQSLTETLNFVVKRLPDGEARAFVTNLAAVVVAHTSRAGV